MRETRLLCIVAVALACTAGPGIAQSACLLPAKLCGELSAGPLRQHVADFHGVTNDKTKSGMFVAGLKTAMTMGERKKARTLCMSGSQKCAWVKA